jgi:hypothetical protein
MKWNQSAEFLSKELLDENVDIHIILRLVCRVSSSILSLEVAKRAL